jgi:hypothetical protein
MPMVEKQDTYQKALSLNLDATIFGSFAEIGAGQEVARWFLRVGGELSTNQLRQIGIHVQCGDAALLQFDGIPARLGCRPIENTNTLREVLRTTRSSTSCRKSLLLSKFVRRSVI